MDTHSLSASVRGFGEHFLKGNTMKGVLTPEWVNNQVFSLVLNEQCLAVPSQRGMKTFSRPFTLSASLNRNKHLLSA